MEQAQNFFCSGCNTRKPKDQFKLHTRDDKHSRKGEPTSRCSHCAMRGQQEHKNLKQKCNGEDTGPPEPGPPISIEQFMVLLHQQALTGKICCQVCVSTQGMVAEDDKEFMQIARHVWEAMGYRFASVWFPLEVIELIFPIIQLDSRQNSLGRMALPKECMSAANLRLIPTIKRRDPGQSLDKRLKPRTPTECFTSLAMDYSI